MSYTELDQLLGLAPPSDSFAFWWARLPGATGPPHPDVAEEMTRNDDDLFIEGGTPNAVVDASGERIFGEDKDDPDLVIAASAGGVALGAAEAAGVSVMQRVEAGRLAVAGLRSLAPDEVRV